MKIIKFILSALLVVVISGCNTLSSLGVKSPAGKTERVGILWVQDCAQIADCAQYSLLDSDMQLSNARLTGDISKSLKGQLIAVLGKVVNKTEGIETLKVEKIKAIIPYDYQHFMQQAVSEYTQQQYGCDTLWDQGYGWRLEGRQPILTVTLSSPNQAEQAQLRLDFNALSKQLMVASNQAEGVNPCQLN